MFAWVRASAFLRHFSVLVIGCIFSFSVSASPSNPISHASKHQKVTTSSSLIVISFIMGEIQAPARELYIADDGAMRYRANDVADGQWLTRQLNQAQLQSLLNFMVQERHFPVIKADAILQQIDHLQQQGRLFAVADALSTRIILTLPRSHSVDFYAVDWAARLFPEINALQDLNAIQNRLLELIRQPH